jgi:NifU-like protein involved in Fe-S cluster formation
MEDDKFYELVEIYRNPEHYGKLDKFNYSETGYSPSCGDKFSVYLDIENGVVKDASFDGKGCVISTVSLSKLCSFLIGRSLKEIERMGLKDIEKMVGIGDISISRVKCATVGLDAVKKVYKEIESKNKPIDN